MKNLLIIMLSMTALAAFSSVMAVDSKQQAPYSACSDKEDGDVCDFTNQKGEDVNGACHRAPGGDGTLICVQYTPG